MQRREFLVGSIGLAALSAGPWASAQGQSRAMVRVLAEVGPNSHDPHGDGVVSASYGLFTNVYDRLINFDRVMLAEGVYKYDYSRFTGELAERYEVLDDGKRLVFHLRRDAKFHDDSPVTAADVHYSLSRAMARPSSKRQLATGSLTDPAQLTVLDAHTFQITLPRPDGYTLPNLALSFASILNARLVQSHATDSDPWAADWLRSNPAGGGAYLIADFQAGQQITYRRFFGWRSGPLPAITDAVMQFVPAAENRLLAAQKGDGDIVLNIPPKDVTPLSQIPGVRVVEVAVATSFRFIAFNCQTAPFNDVRVRQAIAYALPYKDLWQGGNYGHGEPLWGATPGEPATARFPQPYPYGQNLDKARALLQAAGLGNGFKTSFSHSVADSSVADPIALLVQNALAPLGIMVEIDKVPAAQWATRLTEKTVPFYVESSSAWFNEPDYFFRIFFQGDWRWNFGNYNNPELTSLLEAARWESDRTVYDGLMKKAIAMVERDVPLMPLWLPSFQAAVRPTLRGFTYYIHGQVDLRPLAWT